MTSQSSLEKATSPEGPPPAATVTDADLQRWAGEAIDEALAYGARQVQAEGTEAAAALLRAGDPAASGYCHYALAQGTAAHLASLTDDIKSVYIWESDVSPEEASVGDPSALPLMHLIVWVERKTAALLSVIASLDRALAAAYAQQVGLPRLAHLLDVQVVDDADVRHRVGSAAMLSSISQRPMRIWQR
ncbi:MAG: hypothetical protein GX605_06905 [Chloroflexi bacterium]|nr:hypothetical protein [Chloroflexota bacterium]